MRLQRDISYKINRSFIGKTVEVLVDEPFEGEDGKYIGRTYRDAPEVDGTVFVSGKHLRPGEFCKVKIMDALEYDLVGERKGGD